MSPLQPPTSSQRAFVAVCLALGLVTLALYWPVRNHEFIWLDDPDYVTENAFVKMGLSWTSVVWAFTHTFSSNWHPLTWISHMLDWEWFGADAGGHHLVNVVLHTINGLLLLLLLRSATGALWRSAIVAALFAWHPAHVESVAWVAERKDVLSTCFGLLTLLAYVRYVQQSQTRGKNTKVWYIGSLALFACGLMSKPMLVTWPFVMLLLDFWPLGRFGGEHAVTGKQSLALPTLGDPQRLVLTLRRLVWEKLPFFGLVVGSCLVTLQAQDKWRSLAGADQFPLLYRVVNSLVSYAAYLGKLIWPTDLAIFYPCPPELPWERALYSGLLLAAITILILWRWRARKAAVVGWFWYLGTLVPVIGLVQVGGQAMADRYTYIPSIGLFVAVVWMGADLARRVRVLAPILGTIAAITLGFHLSLATKQIANWKDTRTLFEHASNVTTGNFIALNILAEVLWHEGKSSEAVEFYRSAVKAGPSYPYAWCGLGMALYATGEKEEGMACQRRALELNPDNPQALVNLGLLLLWENRAAEAEPLFRHAIATRPGFAEAYANLGLALTELGRQDEALEHFLAAVRFKPESAMMRATLATEFTRLRRLEEALSEYESALRLEPQNIQVRFGYAGVLNELDRAEAVDEFRAVVAASPTNSAALDGLGYALAKQDQVDVAIDCFQRALAASPTNSLARLHLGMMWQRLHRSPEAAAEYRLALETNPQLLPALNNLAWMLATHTNSALRNGVEAIELATRACELTQRREPIFIGTLAAAYAEAGRFAEAIDTAEQARALALEAGLTEIVRRNEELLALYRSGKPAREP